MDQAKSKLNDSLLDAYQRTTYHVNRPAIDIKIGERNEDLAVFLFDNNAFSWAFVSASNPYSIGISAVENQKRTTELIEFAQLKNWRFLRGEGYSSDGNWSEDSLFILDISKNDAIELAKHFEQNAFVFGYLDKTPELILCN
jgi:hypothetical protein